MNKFYAWIDKIWQVIAGIIFVRFEFDIPVKNIEFLLKTGHVVFALTHGGVIEWLILSSWCRNNGLGAIIVSNRKRILLLSKPKYFFQVLFRRKSYADLFLSKEKGPRILFCPNRERKKLFSPTPSEHLLSDIFSSIMLCRQQALYFVTIVIRWRKHLRGSRNLSEYLFGLSSRPNLFGKIWYLIRRRSDSVVKALPEFSMDTREVKERFELLDESEAMRWAKHVRRKILVLFFQEVRVALGPRYQSHHSVKETLIHDPEIQALIEKMAAEGHLDRRKLMTKAYKNLTEIVALYRYRFIEVMYVILSWLFSKLFDAIDVRENEIQEVRETMKTKPLVFVSAHRSHLDYLVTPYVFFLNDMVTPHVAAGINLAFWPIGRFLRRGGAFFIRRSFRGDHLYQLCLKKYIEFLLKNRFNIKFFIEGTRSRSGKMLGPTYGILKMILDVYRKNAVDDIALVPISICYDEVPEVSAYSKELAGEKKTKESASELVKSRKIAKKRIGKVYLRFAPAISLDTNLPKNEFDEKHKTRNLQKIAFLACKRINDVTPLTPKSLLATVFLCHSPASLPLENLLRLVQMLSDFLLGSGHPISLSEDKSLRLTVEQTIKFLQRNGVISISATIPRNFLCERRKRTQLNYYKNNAIHCLISPSISLVSFFSCMLDSGCLEQIQLSSTLDKARRLRDILKFEFFFNPTTLFLEEMKENLTYFFCGSQNNSLGEVLGAHALKEHIVQWSDISIYTGLIGDLLESYLLVLEYLAGSPSQITDKKSLLQRIIKYAEAKNSREEISFPESISLQSYSNALQWLSNKNLLKLERTGEKTMVHLENKKATFDMLHQEISGFFVISKQGPESIIQNFPV